MHAMIFGLCILFSVIAFAQDVDLGGGVIVTQEQLKKIESSFSKLSEDKIFYHWTKRSTALRWITQGQLDVAEVSFYNTPTRSLQAFGPGLYLASSPTSSQGFGDFPVTFKISKGTLLYDKQIVRNLLGRELTNAQASKLGEKIPFIRGLNRDWFLFNHAKHAKEISYGLLSSPEAKFKSSEFDGKKWNIFSVVNDMNEAHRGDGHMDYLKRVLILSDYLDGISFAKALKENPAQPWLEFEPERFYTYEKGLTRLQKEVNGIPSSYQEFKKKLTKVFSIVSGSEETNFNNSMRSEGIRAGGTGDEQRFFATAQELKVLEENPYLEIVSKKAGEGGFWIEYYYPDSLHYKKLKTMLSPELFTKLEHTQPDKLMQDHALRQDLNRKIIEELMEDLYTKHKDIKFRSLDELPLSFMNKLISIHPFPDFNGRTVRLFGKLSFFNSGVDVPYFMMSDMDMMMPVQDQVKFIKASTKAHQILQEELIEEYAIATSQKRIPDYLKKIKLTEFVTNGLNSFGDINLDDPEQLKMIKNRDWTRLIDRISSEAWKKIDGELIDPKFREAATIKIMAGDSSLFARHLPKTNEYIFDILKRDLLRDSYFNLTDVAVLGKYQDIYPLIKNPNAQSPDEMTKIMIDRLSVKAASTADQQELRNIVTALKQIEHDEIVYAEMLASITKKSKKIADLDSINTMIKGLSYFGFSKTYFENLPMENKIRFLDVLHDLVLVNLKTAEKNGNYASVEIYLGFIRSKIKDIPETTSKKYLKLGDEYKKSILKILTEGNSDLISPRLTRGILSDLEIFELLKNNTIPNSKKFSLEFFKECSERPWLIKDYNSSDQKKILTILWEMFDQSLIKDPINSIVGKANLYQKLYMEMPDNYRDGVPHPSKLEPIIKQVFLDNTDVTPEKEVLNRISGKTPKGVKNPASLLIPSLLNSYLNDLDKLEVMAKLSSDAFRDEPFKTWPTTYAEMIKKYTSIHGPFKKMAFEQQKRLLDALKELYVPWFAAFPKEAEEAVQDYIILFNYAHPSVRPKLVTPYEVDRNMKKPKIAKLPKLDGLRKKACDRILGIMDVLLD